MLLATDVSAQPIGPTFKDTGVQEELDYLTPDDGAKRLSRNVGEYYQPTSPNILEDGRPHQMLAGISYTLTAVKVSSTTAYTLGVQYIGPQTGATDVYRGCLQSLQEMPAQSQINHDRFLPHPFKFINH
jgi:hypothetical protein